VCEGEEAAHVAIHSDRLAGPLADVRRVLDLLEERQEPADAHLRRLWWS